MPELPEVETIVRGLRHSVVGQTVASVVVRWPGVVASPTPRGFERGLLGAAVRSVARRGKYILIHAPPCWLVVHLRMTGRLIHQSAVDDSSELDRHVHAIIGFTSGSRLYYRDVRKFGRFWLVREPERLLSGLGPEPLSDEFTMRRFGQMLQSRRRQIKPALLDQAFLAGLGNIYVDEALWLAGLHPLRRTNTLTEQEAACLYAAIRGVLTDALQHRGTTLSDYRTLEGDAGGHQYALEVYGRKGAPCSRCGHPIERTVVGQRGTHYCPFCQVVRETTPTNPLGGGR